MAALVMYPAGGAMSALLLLALELATRVSQPFVGADESVTAANIAGLGYLHAIAGLDEFLRIRERDETIDAVALVVGVRREKIEVACEHVAQTLRVRRFDGDEKSLWKLGHTDSPHVATGTLVRRNGTGLLTVRSILHGADDVNLGVESSA
jgi:hypothetical protein